uniref:Uncharacterized protein n=1 Tax=viral metagenome TaxID=1070528 RepID=A0A6H1Z8U4_9ZZZZ
MSKETDPVVRDLALLDIISKGFFSDDLPAEEVQKVREAFDGLRSSVASWAAVVTELTHEKCMAEAEVDRLRASLAHQTSEADTYYREAMALAHERG